MPSKNYSGRLRAFRAWGATFVLLGVFWLAIFSLLASSPKDKYHYQYVKVEDEKRIGSSFDMWHPMQGLVIPSKGANMNNQNQIRGPLRPSSVASTHSVPSASTPQERAGNTSIPSSRPKILSAATTTITSAILPWQYNLATTILLILAHDRPKYLSRALEAIHKHYPTQGMPVIVISEDGDDTEVAAIVEAFREKMKAIFSVSIVHIHFSLNESASTLIKHGYMRLAEHYVSALSQVFAGGDAFEKQEQRQWLKTIPPEQVIVLEEDLEIAPDFFNYFGTFAPLLQEDKTLLAISAWNDNGQADHVKDPRTVTRTDFFPGLGWMLTRRLWEKELMSKWRSIQYWDDWLRQPEQRKGRQILAPEICRTFHFGRLGTSNGQFSKLLKDVKLNENYVDFSDEKQVKKWSHVRNQKDYDRWLYAEVCKAKEIDSTATDAEAMALLRLRGEDAKGKDVEAVRLLYRDKGHFVSLAKPLHIFSDDKAGVFRSSYKGIVRIYFRGKQVYLVPQGHACLTDCLPGNR
jgi:alpha-1,3-mannosyl-glycoprotein beta-1,2-N-acetylglucosaminyltransferase